MNLKFINEDSQKTRPLKCTAFQDGYLSIHIAQGDQKFKEHFGNGVSSVNSQFDSTWQVDGACKGVISLEPGQSFSSGTTILWNVKPEIQHLSNNSAKYTAETRIISDYALPEPGSYLIKAVFHTPGNTLSTIESAPIQIIIKEPKGENLEVWNKIKGDKEFAYFLHHGKFLTRNSSEQNRVLANVDEIIKKYPNSFYTKRIRQNRVGLQLPRWVVNR